MMTAQLTVGKLRGLQQCSTAQNAIAVLALDHRQGLRKALRPDAPNSVTDADMSAFKQQLTAALAPAASAMLLDPEVGAAQCIASGALPGHIGLVAAVEATGYIGDAGARASQILPGWSVAKAKRMGASAIKLLVYYHPDSPTAVEIENLNRQVAEECTQEDILYFLEPLSYSLDASRKKLPSAEKQYVVVETARRLVIPGVDVLKAEFPLDVAETPNETIWVEACVELSRASTTPWVLLSAAVDYDTYLRQVTIACQNGASGVAVGRAVWKEAVALTGSDRLDFLHGLARQRMARVTALCDALARPWTDFYTSQNIDGGWYERY